jgi:hypothetical protein
MKEGEMGGHIACFKMRNDANYLLENSNQGVEDNIKMQL